MKNRHTMEAMAKKIKRIPDYRHQSAALLAQTVGECSSRQMLRWIAVLVKNGLLEPRSSITYEGVMTVRRIQRYLDQHRGTIYIGILAREVRGAGNNYAWLRRLMDRAVAEGFELDVSRISSEAIPNQMRKMGRVGEGKIRFVSMDNVDAEHRQAWILLMLSWYRIKPRHEVSDAA